MPEAEILDADSIQSLAQSCKKGNFTKSNSQTHF